MAQNTAGDIRGAAERRRLRRLQVALWTIWTAAVVGTATWYFFTSAPQHRFTQAGLAVHCTLVGVVGLIIITLVEQLAEPLLR